jgi:uncharacterized protein (TIGR03085 family)
LARPFSAGTVTAYDLLVSYAQEERAALAALLDETGPDGPTLCEGWQTSDLAAHLVLRERRPDAAVGVLGGPLAGHTARVQRGYLSRYSYPELVALFRSGPPRLSPFAIPAADEAANAVEFFVHHEDVRRAVEGWTERPLDEGLTALLWKRLKGMRLLLRSAPTGLVLAREDDGKLDLIVAKNTVRSGTGSSGTTVAVPDTESSANAGSSSGAGSPANAGLSVTVTGSPAELTLWAMGRGRAAHVTLDGQQAAIAKLAAWRS